MENSEYRVWHPWSDMGRFPRSDDAFAYSNGANITDVERNEYFDASSGLWNVNLGHGREDIIRAISDALKTLTFHNPINTPSNTGNDLALELLNVLPGNLGYVMYHCTGSSATEGAILALRQYYRRCGKPAKSGIIALNGGYHGSSYLMSAVSGIRSDSVWFEPLPSGIHHISAPINLEAEKQSIAELRELIANVGPDCLQSFIAEPIMGMDGAFRLPVHWLAEVAELCRENDISIIADEVATGLGRTGQWFSWPSSVPVDVMVVGKGLGAGYVPLAATLYDRVRFADFFADAQHGEIRQGSTMDGCPAALAAGLAIIRQLKKEDIPAAVNALRQKINTRLEIIQRLPLVSGINGGGLMIGIKLNSRDDNSEEMPKSQMTELFSELKRRGILLDTNANSSILFYPPLNSGEDEINRALDTITEVLSSFGRSPRLEK